MNQRQLAALKRYIDVAAEVAACRHESAYHENGKTVCRGDEQEAEKAWLDFTIEMHRVEEQ